MAIKKLKWNTVFLALLLGGCIQQNDTGTTVANGCPPGTAMVQIGDGYLQIVCGCQEAAGTSAPPGTSLTCSVPVGTQVFFETAGIHMRHQIASTTSAFSPSQVFDPEDEDPQTFPIAFATAGTFDFYFVDLYDSALSGQIVVF